MIINKTYRRHALRIAVGITMLGLLLAGGAGAVTLTVCPSGCTYSSIQTAIDAASDGDTIFVQSGVYGQISVNKRLVLIGDDTSGNKPIIGNGTPSGNLVTLEADGITLDGFEIRGSPNGIVVVSNNNIIANNDIKLSGGGIYLSDSYPNNNNTLRGNNASDNTFGIYGSSSNSTLIGNNAMYNFDGINLLKSSNITLISNNALYNNIHGIVIDDSSDNNLIGNNASSNSYYGIEIKSSSNNYLAGNNVSNNNYRGIYLSYSNNNNNLTDNNVLNNNLGILLSYSSNNNLTGNKVSSNGNDGISLSYSSNNNLISNNVSDNYWGIYLSYSSNNSLRNNIMQKGRQGLFVDGNNSQEFRNNISTSNIVNGLPIMYIDGISTSCPNNGEFSLGSSYSQATLVGCDNVTLQDTNVIDGITFAFTSNSTIKNSNSTGSFYGIRFYSSSNNNLTSNNASDNDNGFSLTSSSNNNLTGNNASNNNYGIFIADSSNDNNLTDNNALNNDNYGIYLSAASNNNYIMSNNASNNSYGIYLSSSNNNNLTGNKASNNTNYGIYLSSSSNNTIYNNFFKNINNFGFDGSINNNYWNSTITSGTNIIGGHNLGGNFWANPGGTGFSQTCADDNHDGICDSSYVFNSDNIDYLPLAATLLGYGYISGKILNNSVGIANVIVATNSSNSTTTDTSGFYSLYVPAGKYNLTAIMEPVYYPNSSVMVTVISGTNVVQDIELLMKPTGNIGGLVRLIWS